MNELFNIFSCIFLAVAHRLLPITPVWFPERCQLSANQPAKLSFTACLLVIRRAVALLRPGAEAQLTDQRRDRLSPSLDIALELVRFYVHKTTGAKTRQEAVEPRTAGRLRLGGSGVLGRLLADGHVRRVGFFCQRLTEWGSDLYRYGKR